MTKEDLLINYNIGAFVCPKCSKMLDDKFVNGFADKDYALKNDDEIGTEAGKGKYWTANCSKCGSVCHSYFNGEVEWQPCFISKVDRKTISDAMGKVDIGKYSG